MVFFTKSTDILIVVAVLFYISCINALENSNDNDLKIMKRSKWGVLQVTHQPRKLESLPAPYVIIIHTTSTPCFTTSKCISHARNIETLHMKQYAWHDIAYNFMVGGNGHVYEGRGWDTEGAHTMNWNNKSIGIAFIGDFTSENATEEQLAAARKLLKMGVEEKKLDSGYKLLGQKQVITTNSPGAKLYDAIQTWDHWVTEP